AGEPAQALRHPRGGTQKALPIGILPQQLELTADDPDQLAPFFAQQVFLWNGTVGFRASIRPHYDHVILPCIPRDSAAFPRAPGAPADPRGSLARAFARSPPPGSRWWD